MVVGLQVPEHYQSLIIQAAGEMPSFGPVDICLDLVNLFTRTLKWRMEH